MILILVSAPFLPAQRLSESTGVNLFQSNCTSCHGITPAEHAPTEATIKQMPPERIYEAITTGSMKNNAAALTDADKRLLAEYMGGRKLDKEDAGDMKNMPNACATHPPVKDMSAPAWNGWGDLSNTRFQPAKAAGLTAGKVSRLKLKWAFGFPGATALYGQTVFDGRVFVSSNAGYVYSLDADTGCVHWSYHSAAVVRSGITIGPLKPGSARIAAFFGDIRGNAYALDASKGELIWKVSTDSHPLARVTGNPRLYQGRLYVPLASLEEDESRSPAHICCTFRGAIVALDSQTGKQVWKTYTIPQEPKVIKRNSAGVDYMGPSGSGVWTAPIVDTKRRALYFGTGNAFSEPATTADSIMAMNMDTGKILWWQQALANDVWHGGCAQTVPGRAALQRPPGAAGPGAGRGNQPPYPPENCVEKTGPDWDYAASPNLATCPTDEPSSSLRRNRPSCEPSIPIRTAPRFGNRTSPGESGAARGRPFSAAQCDQNTIYFGLHLGNGLVAMDLATGVEKWFRPLKNPDAMTAHRGIVAAVSVIPGVFFAGGMDGILRAVSPVDGSPIWEFDTAQEFKTVNGVAAKGGSIGAGGPTIANGMVFVGSGYVGFQNGVPGNVLLAFAPQF